MGTYGITGWKAGGTKPINYGLKAGQFRGMGKVNVFQSRTTIINNNYFGGRAALPPMYSNYNQCYDTGLTKGEKWLLGLGAGTSLLGTILGFFGLGGNKSVEGAGATPEVKAKEEIPVKVPPKTETEETSETEGTEEVETEPETENKPDYTYIANGKRMVCTDASGKTKDISGVLSNVQTDADGVPQSFTLTDETSGNQYNYQVRAGNDGELTYECISKNGQATIGAPNYTLKDGKLVNEEGQNGFGIGIRTKSANKQAPASKAKTQTETPQTKGGLSYEAEQYFNEHPYTTQKMPNGSTIYKSDDGRLVGNSPQQLYDMIQNNKKVDAKSTNKTDNKKYDLNGFANALKAQGCTIKNVTKTANGWNFHVTFPSGKSNVFPVSSLDSSSLSTIKE